MSFKKQDFAQKKHFVEGIGHKVDYAVKENADISKETIKDWMVRDIRGSFIVLSEVLNSNECVEALADVFYSRYKKMHEARNAAPELNLEQKDGI